MQSLVLHPPDIYDAVEKIAIGKVRSPKLKVSLLAFIAGTFVAIGAQTFVALTTYDQSPPYMILGGIFFSTALMGIILCGAELFTGNCLMMMAVFHGQCTLFEVLWEWVFVYCGNFIGIIAFAALNHGGGVNTMGGALTATGQRICSIASKKTHLAPEEQFFRAWLANFCVCTAVLMCMSSKSVAGKVYSCIFPVVCFVVNGYEHSIANMYFFAAATIAKCDVEHAKYWQNLALVTVGNFCGATILSLVYWKVYLHVPAPSPPEVVAVPMTNLDNVGASESQARL